MTTILNGEGPISISQSESVTLSCKSDGVPEPIISWLRNGVVVKSGDIESSFLVITSASESHTGTYTCLGRNDAGVHSDTIVLQVRGEFRYCASYFVVFAVSKRIY